MWEPKNSNTGDSNTVVVATAGDSGNNPNPETTRYRIPKKVCQSLHARHAKHCHPNTQALQKPKAMQSGTVREYFSSTEKYDGNEAEMTNFLLWFLKHLNPAR